MGSGSAVTPREALLRRFLARNGLDGATVLPLADDCSFRRYFRIRKDDARHVVMDAPPDLEDVVPFVTLSRLLNTMGYSAPRILGEDRRDGFLLLDDFGDATYTRALQGGADEAVLYSRATDVLVDLHERPAPDIALPAYTDQRLLDEAVLFVDWYLVRYRGCRIAESARQDYLDSWRSHMPALRDSPPALVLRDYHVDNLMLLEGRTGLAACGLLDFQDAVIGPAGYDLVSLLQDSRRDIADDLVAAMLDRYFAARSGEVDRRAFMRSYHALGIQRALKVFGIFARQSLLYGNHQYLVHLPRLEHHVRANLRQIELPAVRDWLSRHPPFGESLCS